MPTIVFLTKLMDLQPGMKQRQVFEKSRIDALFFFFSWLFLFRATSKLDLKKHRHTNQYSDTAAPKSLSGDKHCHCVCSALNAAALFRLPL